MPQPLDPASAASLASDVLVRTDDLSFEITATPTRLRFGHSRGIPAATASTLTPHELDAPLLYAFRARYRLRRISGWLVTCAVHDAAARALLALACLTEMEAIDLRYPLPETPKGLPFVAPYGNAVTGGPSAQPESLAIAMQFGWRP